MAGEARLVGSQQVEGGAGGKEEVAAVRPAEGQVGGNFRQIDCAQMVALGVEKPAAACAGAEDATVHVHLHAVGYAIFG